VSELLLENGKGWRTKRVEGLYMEPEDEGVSGQDGEQLGSYHSLLYSFLHLPGWIVCTHHVCNAADLG